MPDGRPAIPRDLERSVLTEAGHRCAIPTCRAVPVELAHITPWSKVREHTFENLIALCPTCHTRFDRGDIDRRSMRIYKEMLTQHSSALKLTRATQLATYLEFTNVLNRWGTSIGAIELANVEFESDDGERRRLVDECGLAAAGAQHHLLRFRSIHESEVSRKAEAVYSWYLSWAHDAVDGLWPSTHPGADRHDLFELGDIESELAAAVAYEVNLAVNELRNVARGAIPKLGGTGKRF